MPEETESQIDERFFKEIPTLRAVLEDLDARVTASDGAAAARRENAKIKSREAKLAPLHDPLNRPIPDFPKTPKELKYLPRSTVDSILEALGESTSGDLKDKRLRLRSAIGLGPVI